MVRHTQSHPILACRSNFILCMACWSSTTFPMHAGDKIGVLPTNDFANTSAKSRFVTGNGTWLAAPSAVLMGTDGNTTHAVLLSLGNPTYNSVSKVCESTGIKRMHCAAHCVHRRAQTHGFHESGESCFHSQHA